MSFPTWRLNLKSCIASHQMNLTWSLQKLSSCMKVMKVSSISGWASGKAKEPRSRLECKAKAAAKPAIHFQLEVRTKKYVQSLLQSPKPLRRITDCSLKYRSVAVPLSIPFYSISFYSILFPSIPFYSKLLQLSSVFLWHCCALYVSNQLRTEVGLFGLVEWPKALCLREVHSQSPRVPEHMQSLTCPCSICFLENQAHQATWDWDQVKLCSLACWERPVWTGKLHM